MGGPLKYDTAYFSFCLGRRNDDNTGTTSVLLCVTTHLIHTSAQNDRERHSEDKCDLERDLISSFIYSLESMERGIFSGYSVLL